MMLWILAQEAVKTEPSGIPTWFGLAIQGGSFGLIAYGAIYLLPRIFQGMREDNKANVEAFKAEVEIVRARSDARSVSMTERIASSMTALAAKVDDNTKATRDAEKALWENTAILKKNGGQR